ncbi:putative FAD-dependent monooxygenase [Lachnellula arida]|uniref:Putative FAD-dependent monooxygenase n=1 Tax=Lachnellula arida TaxID=1316785 RepID=A0A8T9B0M4_9HELO|nr:putative FAD-dependent monooxygenase [Lachnellula arida]
MAVKSGDTSSKPGLHVLIAGAGVVGLTIAQGCKRNGIPFTIFEKDEHRTSRPQGWAVTLHWSLNSLRRTIGPELSETISETSIDPSLQKDKGNFLFLNAETGDVRYKIPPSKERVRLNRLRLLNHLSTGLDIQWGKSVASYEDLPDGTIKVHFRDGPSATGSMLVGCDGSNSKLRHSLITDEQKSNLTTLPIKCTGVVRHFTPDEGAEPRSVDPLLFMGLQPKTSNFLWYSVQDVYTESDGRLSFDALVMISWPVKDEEKDAIPPTKRLCVANMKERASGFYGTFRRIVEGIPDDSESVTSLTLADFPVLDWESNHNVTLAGDAAHAMTMYRGEGANHGILDAALLVDQLAEVQNGELGQAAAIEAYEKEMKVRGAGAVLKSRQACLDAHCWELINDDCPLIGGRWPPATA